MEINDKSYKSRKLVALTTRQDTPAKLGPEEDKSTKKREFAGKEETERDCRVELASTDIGEQVHCSSNTWVHRLLLLVTSDY